MIALIEKYLRGILWIILSKNRKMEDKDRQKQANEWQFIGHKSKTETHNLFLTFVVATIGFAASTIFVCDCSFSILTSCFGSPLFFISLILLFIVLLILFNQSKFLKDIAFKYSEVLGSPEQEGEWVEVDQMHDRYYWNFNIAFYMYVSALIMLIVSILFAVYKS